VLGDVHAIVEGRVWWTSQSERKKHVRRPKMAIKVVLGGRRSASRLEGRSCLGRRRAKGITEALRRARMRRL